METGKSPRRRHAIEHAVTEVYGCHEGHLKGTVNGINTGLLRMRRERGNIPVMVIEDNIYINETFLERDIVYCTVVM